MLLHINLDSNKLASQLNILRIAPDIKYAYKTSILLEWQKIDPIRLLLQQDSYLGYNNENPGLTATRDEFDQGLHCLQRYIDLSVRNHMKKHLF